jgi:1,4-dihydroxy-2-naphthoate octaprenyltransferase
MGQFLITALINLILFSWFDYQRDLQDRRESLVTFLGHRIGKFLLIGLFLVQGSITVYLRMHSQDPVVVMVFAMMNLVLVFIFWESNFFSLDDRYRYAGDAVFFFPLIYLVA